ncbi:MAG: acetyl-CoA carboxylase biotin carboxyl carrier protein [Chlamydiota bacterium]
MDIEQIKELMRLLEDSKLSKLTLKDEKGCEIHLEKPAVMGISHQVSPQMMSMPVESTKGLMPIQVAQHQEVSGQYITSPMVGTFYKTASPSDPPFVAIGGVVDEGSIVCIIEAMKVMNEIKAGIKGKIVEICVENGHAVEFGTRLFRVE